MCFNTRRASTRDYTVHIPYFSIDLRENLTIVYVYIAPTFKALFGRAYIVVHTKNLRTVNSIASMTLAHGKAAHIVQAIGITSPYGASKAVSLGFFGPIPHQPK